MWHWKYSPYTQGHFSNERKIPSEEKKSKKSLIAADDLSITISYPEFWDSKMNIPQLKVKQDSVYEPMS